MDQTSKRYTKNDLSLYLDVLMQVGNLNEHQATTLVYYCIMTRVNDLKIRPLLEIHGVSGTGKSSIMRQMELMCNKPKRIDGKNKTPARFRDELADAPLVFIDEVDKVQDLSDAENWLQYRYDDSGLEVRYKKMNVYTNTKSEIPKAVPETQLTNFCGFTVMHTQNSFKSAEMGRRTIRVTVRKNPRRKYTQPTKLRINTLRKIADSVNWHGEIEQEYSNSAWDAWLPFLRIAQFLGDEEYIQYVKEQIDAKTEEEEMSNSFEPSELILEEISALYQHHLEQGGTHIPIMDVRQRLLARGYPSINERQIATEARDFGFQIVKPHNRSNIKVNSQKELKKLITNEIKTKKMNYSVSEKRLRNIAINSDFIKIDIYSREGDPKKILSKCPVCDNNLKRVKNLTIWGGEVTIEFRCLKCGYWTGKKKRIPNRYVFHLNKKK